MIYSWKLATNAVFIAIAVCLSGCILPPFEHYPAGEVRQNIKSDTLQIHYDITIDDESCRSAILRIRSAFSKDTINTNGAEFVDSLLFSNAGNLPSSYPTRLIDSSNHKIRLRGILLYPNHKQFDCSRYWIEIFSDRKADSTSNLEPRFLGIGPVSFYPTGCIGRESEVGWAIFDKSGFPPDVRSKNKRLQFHFSDKLGYYKRNYSVFIGARFNYSSSFHYNDYIIMGFDVFPAGRDRLWPSLTFGGKLSQIKTSAKPALLVKSGLGIEAGIRLNGKFESFKYSYSSFAGGCHRFDMSFSLLSLGALQDAGTQYTYYRGRQFEMFQVSFLMDTWGMKEDKLGQIVDRPFWHFALVAIPWLPLMLLMGLGAME